ncbi:MAG: insulinase family protein, partial [Bacteroidetes bacterium]|nr:insulinase family protein [Bacteroidota bacterium]
MNWKQWMTAGITCMLLNGGIAQPLPLDTAVHTGKLANGFTYYIRHNGQPQKRVELYLVNKVGSILEDDDQQGLAHFIEHMNFNGTRHFPKNELVDHLQKAGVRFGADLNAYTSFDETVYQLPLPTDEPGMLPLGLQIMRDWAQEATLDPAEIEKERGVVLEEERLGKGATDRMQRQYFPMLMNHARYAERLPIGKDVVLKGFRPDVIRRFHHDWYRPDLQALIVVGDIDVAETEKLIRQQFADLMNPANERERTGYTVPLTGNSQFMRVTDAEEPGTSVEILMKHRVPALQTEQDYLLLIKKNLLNQLLNSRREAELSAEPHPSYTGISLGISGLISNIDMLGFSVTARDGRLEQSFRQGMRILERIKKYSFTEGELERAKQNYLRSLQSSAGEQGKIPSVSYVKEYQRLFLQGEASPGIAWEYRFTKEHINGITIGDINQLLNEYLASKDVDVLVTAPEKNRQSLPDSATVQDWIAGVGREALTPWKEDLASRPLLPALPKAGTVIKKEIIASLGITRLTLSNGLQVVLKPTDFKNDQILYGAFGRGGASLYEHSDFDMAVAAANCIISMGFGSFSPVELDKAVTGKVVRSHPAIGLRNQTIMASCSPQDLETALQLTWL